MKINPEIVLLSFISILAPYFLLWFVAAYFFLQPPPIGTWIFTVSAICWAIGLLWFYMQTLGLYYFLKQKIHAFNN